MFLDLSSEASAHLHVYQRPRYVLAVWADQRLVPSIHMRHVDHRVKVEHPLVNEAFPSCLESQEHEFLIGFHNWPFAEWKSEKIVRLWLYIIPAC